MHAKSTLVCLLMLSLPATAQDATDPLSPRDALHAVDPTSAPPPTKPYSLTVQQAFFASGMKSAKPVLRVDYDAQGIPVKLEVDPASGNEALDQAILAWGSQIRLPPGRAGKGRVPFDLSSESGEPPPTPYGANIVQIDFDAPVLKAPSFDSVTWAFRKTNLTRVSTELLIDYNIEGDVVYARLTAPTMSGSLDKAMVKWAKRLKFKPGASGSWRLPVKFGLH